MFRLFSFVACLPVIAQTLQSGDYEGAAQVGVSSMRMALHLAANPDGSWAATMDSLDQGVMGIPIRTLRIEGDSVRFGNFEGTLNADGTEISGRLTLSTGIAPIVFRRVAKVEGPARPQMPIKPYPYNEEDVTFEAKGAQIAGTLTWPKTGGPFAAAILLSGSGPQDRDSTMFGHKPFLVLADDLTRRGFAVLRMDDRGVGKSTGALAQVRFDELADDAVKAAEFLRTRKEIDPKRIGYIGHSEGGYIAPMAAVQATAAFVILLAGPGVPGDQLLYEQGQAGLKAANAAPAVIERQSQLQHLIFPIVLTERDSMKLEAKLRDAVAEFKSRISPEELAATPGFDQQMQGEVRRWMIPELQSLLRHDPGPFLKALQCPVLAIGGSLDTLVPPRQNLPAIEAALTTEDSTVVMLPKLNHLLQTTRTGASQEYAATEETIAPAALRTIGEWLKARFTVQPAP